MSRDDFLEWINAVERMFDYKVADDHKIKLIAKEGLPHNGNKAMRERRGKTKVNAWEKMKSQSLL